jgi:hypothetical protein
MLALPEYEVHDTHSTKGIDSRSPTLFTPNGRERSQWRAFQSPRRIAWVTLWGNVFASVFGRLRLLPVPINPIPATLTAGNCKAGLLVNPEQLKRSGVLLRV